jgi:hypothetical protein
VKLTKKENTEFLALAAAIHSARNEHLSAIRSNAQQAAAEPAQLQAQQQARQRHHLVASAAAPHVAGNEVSLLPARRSGIAGLRYKIDVAAADTASCIFSR